MYQTEKEERREKEERGKRKAMHEDSMSVLSKRALVPLWGAAFHRAGRRVPPMQLHLSFPHSLSETHKDASGKTGYIICRTESKMKT